MIEQRTIEWYRARLGHITGSECGDLMGTARAKTAEWSKTAESYMYKVAAQRMLKDEVKNDDCMLEEYLEQFGATSKSMQWGIDHEDDARELYSSIIGRPITLAEFTKHDTVENFGASPDGFIDDDRVLEIKCVGPARYAEFCHLFGDNMFHSEAAAALKLYEPKYYWQAIAEMACTGRDWCDFLVYNPYMKGTIRVAHIMRDLTAELELIEKVRKANDYINKISWI